MFGRNKKKKEEKKVPVKSKELNKAEKIAKQYIGLSKCCEILSKIEDKGKDENDYLELHPGGWRVMGYTIKNAGIDIEEIYDFIKKLVLKRKAELESELSKFDA